MFFSLNSLKEPILRLLFKWCFSHFLMVGKEPNMFSSYLETSGATSSSSCDNFYNLMDTLLLYYDDLHMWCSTPACDIPDYFKTVILSKTNSDYYSSLSSLSSPLLYYSMNKLYEQMFVYHLVFIQTVELNICIFTGNGLKLLQWV